MTVKRQKDEPCQKDLHKIDGAVYKLLLDLDNTLIQQLLKIPEQLRRWSWSV